MKHSAWSVGLVIVLLAAGCGWVLASSSIVSPPRAAYAQFDTPTPLPSPTWTGAPANTPTHTPTHTPPPPPTNTPTPLPVSTNTPTPPPVPTNTPTSVPGDTPTPTSVPAETPPPPPPPQPAQERQPAGTPSNAAVGWYVYVVKPEGIPLGAAPGFDAAHVQMALAGDQLCVIGGPVYVDTLWWWQFRTVQGREGWGISDGVALTSSQCAVGAAGRTPTPAARRTSALPDTGADFILLWAGVASVCLLLLVGLVRRRSMPSS